MDFHGLDDKDRVFFYGGEYYCLSNFSAFRLWWNNVDFDTSEEAYHWEKFSTNQEIRNALLATRSAHDAYKLAHNFRDLRRPDWDQVKVGIMRQVLMAKACQHEYVKRKLLETGNRVLIEDSWRDAFWGWGPNRDGQNMLGVLWMEVRKELRV